jgi:hypothetical protein
MTRKKYFDSLLSLLCYCIIIKDTLVTFREITMKNFDTRVYSISDFLEWSNNNLLELSPDFQRRAVWSEKAKSYLIDTIVRGRPIPKILISQRMEGSRTVRVVVDGQQRLRAILGFLNGDFKISRAHNKELAGYTFEKFLPGLKKDFLQYELGIDLLIGVEYEDILDIFARINSYTVSLNPQEKINATYLGYFKQYVFRYGVSYVQYLLDAGVLTKARVTRMAEAEIAADLFVALMEGVQTNKKIEQYYKKYDDTLEPVEEAAKKFDNIMSYVGSIYPAQELVHTNWSRVQLFYTLFVSIGHCLYGLKGLDPKNRISINEKMATKLRVKFDEISSAYTDAAEAMDKKDPESAKEYREFVNWSRRGTTDTGSRVGRADFVCSKLKLLMM